MTYAINDWEIPASGDTYFSDIEVPEIVIADIEDFADIVEIARRDCSDSTASY